MSGTKVGVIGAGAWGKNLLKTFHAMGSLGGVAEPVEALLAEAGKIAPGVPLFRTHGELLSSAVDAVAVATPSHTHAEIAEAAFRAGKDVFVEKPLALTVQESRRLIAAAEKARRILMVGHLLLYQPAIGWIRNHLARGSLGALYSIHQERLKLGRVRAVENVLWSFGVHDIAVILSLVGRKPDSVRALGQRSLQAKVEDDVRLHMQFSGGVQAHLRVSWLWPETRRRLTLVGSGGMLVYDELTQEVTLHEKKVRADLSHVDQGSRVVFRGDPEPLRLELEHFLECVRHRKTPLSDGANGLAVVEILEEATRQLVAR